MAIEEREFTEHNHTGIRTQKIRGKDLLGFSIFDSVPTHDAPDGTFVWYHNGADYRLYARLNSTWQKVGDVDYITSIDNKFINARECYPSTTNGCSTLQTTEWATNDIDFQTLDFDPDSVEYAQTSFIVPTGINSTTATAQIYWNSNRTAQNAHAIDFELSSSQYLSITDAAQTGLDFNDNFTIEAWVKLEQLASDAGGDVTIASKRNPAGGSQDGWRLFFESSDDKLYIECYDNGSRTLANMDTAFDANDVDEWVHVAVSVVLDQSGATTSIAFYKNGSAVTSNLGLDNIDNMSTTTAPFRIGASNDGLGAAEDFFDGIIDEVRVWSDVRTALEINDNYNTELLDPTNEANLEGYWAFDGQVLTDGSTNGNDLTNNNSATFTTDTPDIGGIGALDSVMWSIEAICYEDGDPVDVSWGTAIEQADANTYELGGFNISPEMTFTPNGTIQAGNLLQIRIGRQADDGSDDFLFDAQFIGLKIVFN